MSNERRQPGYLAAFLTYLALTLLFLAPLLPHLADSVAGGVVARRDAWQNIWNLWWVQQAVSRLQNPFHTSMLYYPDGTGLYLQTLNITNGLLALPVTALIGPTAGYNTAAILAFALTGLGGYALALRVSGSPIAALIGGLALTFSPFHITKLWDGQLEMIALQWAPLYVLFLLRAVEDRRRRDALLAGMFLALIGYTSWYYFLFFAVFSALFAGVWLAAPPEGSRRWAMLRQLAIAGASGVILLLPILLPALQAVRGGPGDEGPDPFGYLKIIHSADLVDFWLPNALHPLWGPAVTRVGEQIHPYIAAWNIALGYLTLGLALLAGLLRRGASWRWWLVALAALLLSLGPVLQIGGAQTGIPLPYALLAYVPGVDIAHRPSHFIVITVVLLAPLVALGAAALLERIPLARRRAGALLIGGLLLFELAPPIWPIFQSHPHPYYQQIARGAGALIDLPARLESSEPLEAQLIHQMPMMGGYVSRTPAYPFGRDVPVVRDLWALGVGERVLLPSGPNDALVVLNAFSLRHVIVHWDRVAPGDRPALEQALAAALPGVAASYADATLSAYQVPIVAPRPFAYVRAMERAPGEPTGWYGEEREGQRRWRWMGERGEVVVYNPGAEPAAIEITLVAQSYAEECRVALRYGGQPAGGWLVRRGDTPLTLRLLAPPGESVLQLDAPTTPEEGRSQRRLSIVLTGGETR